jgi:hypothetical protein
MTEVELEPRAREELRRLQPDEKIITAAMLVELRRRGSAAATGGYHTRRRSYLWIASSVSVAFFSAAPSGKILVLAIVERG